MTGTLRLRGEAVSSHNVPYQGRATQSGEYTCISASPHGNPDADAQAAIFVRAFTGTSADEDAPIRDAALRVQHINNKLEFPSIMNFGHSILF